MNSSKGPNASVEDFQKAFLQGSIRKELGLESMDLRPALDVAKNNLQRGATVEAMRIYMALVLCEPANVDFQVGLANCSLQMEQHHMALHAASAIVALAPTDPRGYFLSGRACLGMGHYPEAREDLTDAVEFARKARDAAIANEASNLLQKLAALQS